MIFIPFKDNDISGDEKKIYTEEIQELLRELEIAEKGASDISVDGIFGPVTAAAVGAFQKQYGLPITNTVDRATFYKIIEQYNYYVARNVFTVPIKAFPSGKGYMLRAGNAGDIVYFLNIMLRTIAKIFSNIPTPEVNDTYSSGTQAAVSAMQTVMGIPATGVTNRQTWNGIANLYNDIGENIFEQIVNKG